MRRSIWPHSLIRLWIDLLWGNHHIILCAPLKCAPGHVMVLGVDSVIKVHNRIAVMAIRLSRLIPRIIHQPISPVSDHEEGCRWSGVQVIKKKRTIAGRKCSLCKHFKVPNSFLCSDSKILHLYYRSGKKKKAHD